MSIPWEEPTPTPLPPTVEGLPTGGAMGTQPLITIGTVVIIVQIVLALIKQYAGWAPPPEWTPFFDQYGTALAGIAATMLTAGIGWFKVFSPRSAAELAAGVR